MKVTYILPTIRKRFLNETLLSIMNQTLTDWEVMILDGAGVAKDINNPRMRRIDTSGITVSAGFNRAIEMAQSDIMLNICDDDVDLPHRAQYLYYKMEETKADVFLASYNRIDENGYITGTVPVDHWDIKQYLYGGLNMPLWSGAYRKSTCPSLREDFWLLGDYCFFIDCHIRGLKILTSYEVVANIRHWSGQLCQPDTLKEKFRQMENIRLCKLYNLERLNR